MRHLFLLFILISSITSTIFAQQNFCSEVKSNRGRYFPESGPESIQEVLMNKYDVKFYHLNLNLERTSTDISGWVRSISIAISPLDTFAFELYNAMILDSVFSGTQKLLTAHVGNFCYAKFPTTKALGALLDIKVYYHGTPPKPGTAAIGDGITNATDASSGLQVTYTLSQPYSAEEWWPCKQSLQDKIDSSYVYITTDSANKVGSNGKLKNTVVIGNKKRYEWQQTNPIECYLISVAVTKYYDYSFYAYPVNTPPILIQNYIYDNPTTIAAMKPQFNNTKSIMELYCKLFGPYAFANEKYGHSMAPLGGGMEHQTMTTLGVINYEIIAHELGHQWFGDAVTCATWNDIWVNEGFATYTAYLAYQYLDTARAPQYMVNSHNSAMSAPDGSVWCNDTSNVGRIFSSRLTYQKGSSIIHMIRFELNNDTLFFNILKEYIRKFKGGTATALNFKKVVEDLSGKDFTRFFNQWYFGEGYPTFNLFWNQLGSRLSIINAQSTSMPSSVSLFNTPVEYKIKTTKGDTTIKVYFTKNVQGTAITIKDSVIAVQVDPSNWLLCKSSSVKDPNQLPIGINTDSPLIPDIFIYPNPSKDEITITTGTFNAPLSYRIYDALGKAVKSGVLLNANTLLDTHTLATGFYVIRVGDHNQMASKFVKQ